ncbi:MAG: peptidoglycan-binding protein, partial [Nitrososphaera sp.]|nr:peptidoglycan-binding protein [Nitrososphaera sp.]
MHSITTRIAHWTVPVVIILSAGIAFAQTTSGPTGTSYQVPVVSSMQCTIIPRGLSRGMQGSDVVQLQLFLIVQGHLAVDNATGYFGPLTAQAVIVFQTANGLPPVGI